MLALTVSNISSAPLVVKLRSRTQNANDILSSSNLFLDRFLTLGHSPPLRTYDLFRGTLQDIHNIPHLPQWLPREPVDYPPPELWRANIVNKGQDVLTRNVELAVHGTGLPLSRRRLYGNIQ